MKNKQKKIKNSNWKIAIWSGQSLLIPWFELIRRQTNNDDDDDDQLDWFVFFLFISQEINKSPSVNGEDVLSGF